jgi:hypothetical protein
MPVSRRVALAGGLGITALIALPDVLLGSTAQAARTAAGASPSAATAGATALPAATASQTAEPGHFFLYGTTGAGAPSNVQGWQTPTGQDVSAAASANVTTNLNRAPVKSPDNGTLALISTGSTGSVPSVTLTLVDTQSGANVSTSVLKLPGVSATASILATPVFAGQRTVALVLAVSEPSHPRAVHKVSPTGLAVTTTGYTWTTSHVVAYLDRASGSFAGPFTLFDSPYLALTDAVADAGHLYLWAIKDYTKIRLGKGRANPTVSTEFFAVPLGSGTPRLALPSAGPWPSGATAQVLSTGDVARLIGGRRLEVFSPGRSSLAVKAVVPMTQVSAAKPGATTLDSLANGNVLITNSALGRATVLDPAASYSTVSVVDYPRVPHPVRGATISADGTTLYTLGAASTGGLNAYNIASGSLTATDSHGESYIGVFQLSSGTLLALKPAAQTQLSFFAPHLENIGTASTNILVAAAY